MKARTALASELLAFFRDHLDRRLSSHALQRCVVHSQRYDPRQNNSGFSSKTMLSENVVEDKGDNLAVRGVLGRKKTSLVYAGKLCVQ